MRFVLLGWLLLGCALPAAQAQRLEMQLHAGAHQQIGTQWARMGTRSGRYTAHFAPGARQAIALRWRLGQSERYVTVGYGRELFRTLYVEPETGNYSPVDTYHPWRVQRFALGIEEAFKLSRRWFAVAGLHGTYAQYRSGLGGYYCAVGLWALPLDFEEFALRGALAFQYRFNRRLSWQLRGGYTHGFQPLQLEVISHSRRSAVEYSAYRRSLFLETGVGFALLR